MLLLLPVFSVVVLVCRFLQAFAPSNLLIARVRRQPPRWRISALMGVLALLLVAIAHVAAVAADSGWPGWLNLLSLIAAWDAIKFGVFGLLVMVRRTLADPSRRRPRASRRDRHAIHLEEVCAG